MIKNTDRPHTDQPVLYPLLMRVFLVLLSLFVSSGPVFAAPPVEVSPDKPAEYMIYQYPGVALLVRIDAVGIEFESRVLAPERSLVMASRIPGRRIGPLYQLIEAVDKPRQLIIQVRPKRVAERSQISMELVQLSGNDRNSAAQLKAFRLLSLATESTQANDTTTWSMKIYTLKNAAQAFAQLGWEELRLWSEYYAAHLVFYKLQDNLSAMELARQVEMAARKAGIGIVELAALQLEASALVESAAASSGLDAAANFDEAHRTYQLAATMADSLGLQQERSWAIFSNGLAWEQQENLDRALEQYELSLSIAMSEGNDELANLARSKAAYVYEMQGSLSGAIEILDQAENREGDESERLRQATALLEKGRLLSSSAYFPGAVEALTQSLLLQREAGARIRQGLTALHLGQAYYGLGHLDQAATVLQEALRITPTNTNTEALRDAFSTLAGISRIQGNASSMAEYREQQADFVVSEQDQAKYSFEQSLDALSTYGRHSETTRSLFSRSRQQADKAGNEVLQHRSILYGCSLAFSGRSDHERTCSKQAVRLSVDYLLTAGIPANSLEAKWLWAKIVHENGRLSTAIQQMSRLVEDMRFFRSTLPGVLGAWYWENREEIYADYMSMVLERSAANRQAFVDGRQSLVALNGIRAVESQGGFLAGAEGQDGSSQFRNLLAKNQQTQERLLTSAEVAEINEWLHLARSRFTASAEGIDEKSLDRLLKQMNAESALLSYYFSDNKVYVLVGRNDGVQLMMLPAMQGVKTKLAEVRAVMGKQEGMKLKPSLDSLGTYLLAPVENLLPEFIYLMPAGPLNGFPFDLLRHNGQYLSERRGVINIESPSALSNGTARVNTTELDLFFLAGKPDTERDFFDYDQNFSAEIQSITDIFVGPSLHIVQGSALGRDEFYDGRFESADIIHLAIPGTINLGFPERSRMILSGTADSPASKFLWPGDFREINLKAKLAVFSGLSIEGMERLSVDQQLGFVSDILASGVSLVITSLWRVPDAERAQFFGEFYKNLEGNPDIAAAFSKTRRAFLSASDSMDYSRWGGFQLYIK
jgi:CHAT domain-containing protein/tetratricopeptide (TPR) repeat protein